MSKSIPRIFSMFVSMLAVHAAGAAQLLVNGSFEDPVLPQGKAVIDPTNNAWTFTHPSGLISPPGEPNPGGGNYGGYAAPNGAQYAFLQCGANLRSTISQQVTLPTTGQYQLSFLEAGRPSQSFTLPTGGDVPYSVLLGSTVLGTFATTTGERFTPRTLNFSANAGTYLFEFAAGITAQPDETAFIDNVILSPAASTSVPLPPAVYGLLPAFLLAGIYARRFTMALA
jgi:hypothetical protein